jgi:hypothetical protein
MRLADKSSIHNCGRNILSSIFDLRQVNNIRHCDKFCAENLAAQVLDGLQPVGFEFGGGGKSQMKTGGSPSY